VPPKLQDRSANGRRMLRVRRFSRRHRETAGSVGSQPIKAVFSIATCDELHMCRATFRSLRPLGPHRPLLTRMATAGQLTLPQSLRRNGLPKRDPLRPRFRPINTRNIQKRMNGNVVGLRLYGMKLRLSGAYSFAMPSHETQTNGPAQMFPSI